MPKVSDEHREARRQQILEAAMRSFLRRGFQESSMSDIIAESGLSAGAIYGYFSGKADIIAAVAEEVLVKGWGGKTDVRDEKGAPVHPLDFIAGLSGGMLDHLGGTALLVQIWGRAAIDPEVRRLVERVLPMLNTAVTGQTALWLREVRGMDSGEADARAASLAPVIAGVLQGMILQQELAADFDRANYLALARPIVDAV